MKKAQQGVFLIEALIAILIFSLGVLGLVAMGGGAIAAQSDAQYRLDAANLANEIANTISLNVDRIDAGNVYGSPALAIDATIAPFAYRPAGANCAFSGGPAPNPQVAAWLNKVTTVGPGLPGLPGATAAMQQIAIQRTSAGGFNRVSVTLCWQAPNDRAVRQHTLVTYVN